jgi:hypothetical protein
MVKRKTSQKLCACGFIAKFLETKVLKPIGPKEKKINLTAYAQSANFHHM